MAKSILLVDDDPDIRETLGDYLAQRDFTVHTARDGHHALQVLSHIPRPDVILLDYNMPVMNGSQFLVRKRWNPNIRYIPVVILAAWSRAWSGTKLDAVEVLSKPVDLERLVNLIRRICSGAHSISIHGRRASRPQGETVGSRAVYGAHATRG